ncbi:hypothetical protein COSO111634_37935 [Corallococcus soli]
MKKRTCSWGPIRNSESRNSGGAVMGMDSSASAWRRRSRSSSRRFAGTGSRSTASSSTVRVGATCCTGVPSSQRTKVRMAE